MDEHRQLAAIMFTDIVGFTALMAENESEALFLLKKFRKALKRAINRFDGEWLETAGDGVLARLAAPSMRSTALCWYDATWRTKTS